MKLVHFDGTGDGDTDNPTVLHLHHPTTDYTLCGITMDGDEATAGGFETVESAAVTCPDCVAIINHCRGVRTK